MRTEPPVPDAGPLPCGADGPVFREPWEAQAFAIVVALHQRGLFEWTEWARYLSEAIRQALKPSRMRAILRSHVGRRHGRRPAAQQNPPLAPL